MDLNIKPGQALLEIKDIPKDWEGRPNWPGCEFHYDYSYNLGGSSGCVSPEEIEGLIKEYAERAHKDGLNFTLKDERASSKLGSWM